MKLVSARRIAPVASCLGEDIRTSGRSLHADGLAIRGEVRQRVEDILGTSTQRSGYGLGSACLGRQRDLHVAQAHEEISGGFFATSTPGWW